MKHDPSDSPPAGSRVSLRGVERMVSATDGVSTKLAHSMLVRGDTATLLRFLPTALLNTFNKHPRMRALQVRDQLFTAEIQAPVTASDLASLLHVRMLAPADYGDGAPSSWQAFVERECSIGFDRYTQLPFYLTVWIAKRKACARFMLFSDQYMSDSFSGVVVLHCLLEQIALLARAQQHHVPSLPTVTECPLSPSLYCLWLKRLTWAKPLLKGTTALFGRRLFRGHVHRFTPLVSARSDQKDFAVPPVANSTLALFADGEPTCMQQAQSRCRHEGVTLQGVLTVVVLLAFYRVQRTGTGDRCCPPFRVVLDVDCNMRPHVQGPLAPDDGHQQHQHQQQHQVGLFTATTDSRWLTSEGVDVLATRFWDAADRATQEGHATLKHTRSMALPAITADLKLNAAMDSSFLRDVRVAHSLIADAGVAEVVRYPFATHHSLTAWSEAHSQSRLSPPPASPSSSSSSSPEHRRSDLMLSSDDDGAASRPLVRPERTDSATPREGLSIDSLHVYKALPHLAPSATVFLSAVHAFGYAMAHKVEPDVANELFTTLVVIYESVGSIGRDETLLDVLTRVDADHE